MERNQALEIVKPHLTDYRYQHTLGVVEAAIELAERFDGNKEKAELAAIFHDYAKFRDRDEMRLLVKNTLTNKLILDYGDELLHAPCAAYYLPEEVGVTDEEILQAIASHTTGRVGMSLLEKIIFLADYIEPGRQFQGVDQVRQLAKKNLDAAIIQALEQTICFLLKRRQLIYPETLATYNDLVKKNEN